MGRLGVPPGAKLLLLWTFCAPPLGAIGFFEPLFFKSSGPFSVLRKPNCVTTVSARDNNALMLYAFAAF